MPVCIIETNPVEIRYACSRCGKIRIEKGMETKLRKKVDFNVPLLERIKRYLHIISVRIQPN